MNRARLESNPVTRFALNAGRWANYARLRREARRIARGPLDPRAMLPVCFVVACGRSGTTILSDVINAHPAVRFLFDPGHLWECIDTRTDLTALNSPPRGKRVFFGADDFEPGHRDAYQRLIASAGDPGVHACIVEKSPINSCRIGWIERLDPDAKYIHIARNGLAVSRSIEQISIHPTYRVAFRPHYDQWWGEKKVKWPTLAEQGEARGYAPGETALLTEERQRGAYEWVVSLSEIRRARETLGDRLLEFTITDLTNDPAGTLTRVAAHLGIDPSQAWLDQARSMIKPEHRAEGYELRLPPALREDFNRLQREHGFEGEAGAL